MFLKKRVHLMKMGYHFKEEHEVVLSPLLEIVLRSFVSFPLGSSYYSCGLICDHSLKATPLQLIFLGEVD